MQTSDSKYQNSESNQPSSVRTWGTTLGGALAGALVVGLVSNPVVAVVSTLTIPTVSLVVGGVGGGLLGWKYVKSSQIDKIDEQPYESPTPAPVSP